MAHAEPELMQAAQRNIIHKNNAMRDQGVYSCTHRRSLSQKRLPRPPRSDLLKPHPAAKSP
jgi:hypothetical protein